MNEPMDGIEPARGDIDFKTIQFQTGPPWSSRSNLGLTRSACLLTVSAESSQGWKQGVHEPSSPTMHLPRTSNSPGEIRTTLTVREVDSPYYPR